MVKKYLNKHRNIRLYHLPPYSPEYNPVELFWKWIAGIDSKIPTAGMAL